MSHLKLSSRLSRPTSGTTPGSRVTGAGFCFFFKKASFRLTFLLRVDGLFLFIVLLAVFVFETTPLPLASREKEKEEPILREKLKAKPWLANVWQRSRHLVAKEDSHSPTAVILVYF